MVLLGKRAVAASSLAFLAGSANAFSRTKAQYGTTRFYGASFGLAPCAKWHSSSRLQVSTSEDAASATIGKEKEPVKESELETQSDTDFATAMPTIYDKLGFQEDQLAIGIDPHQLLRWIGTREDLIGKFMRDNKPFDRERAEKEVDKFVKDAEMVNKYIAYEKKKADPDFLRKQEEQSQSDPSVLGLYAAWIAGGAGFAYFKNVIAAPKFASGEWQDVHIQLPQFFPFGQQAAESLPAVDAVTSSADAAVAAFDSAHSAVDAVAGSLPFDAMQSTVEGAAGAVTDALK